MTEVYDVTGQTSHFIGRCIRLGMAWRGPARTPTHDEIVTTRAPAGSFRRAGGSQILGAHRLLLDHSLSRCPRLNTTFRPPIVVDACTNPASGLAHVHWSTTMPRRSRDRRDPGC